jgi:hypothetical protein
MNRVIVMFVALFVGVSGSAFLMMQGTHRTELAQSSSGVKTTADSQPPEDEGKISAIESKATVTDENRKPQNPRRPPATDLPATWRKKITASKANAEKLPHRPRVPTHQFATLQAKTNASRNDKGRPLKLKNLK